MSLRFASTPITPGNLYFDTEPPPPSGMTVDITLNWTDNSDDEDQFNIYREESVTQPTQWGTPIASVGADVTTYVDTNRPTGTWWYRVTAFNANGESVDEGSNILSITV